MNAKNDNEITQELSAYLDGELNAADSAKVEKALSESPELVKQLEQLKATRDMLRGLPKAAAPEGFAARVMAAAEKNKHARPRRRVAGWYWGSGVAAAVIIAAVAVGYPLLVQRKGEGNETTVAQHGQAKKLGELARDMKSDVDLDSTRREKKELVKQISGSGVAGRPMVGNLPKSATSKFGVGEKDAATSPSGPAPVIGTSLDTHDDYAYAPGRDGKQLLIAGKLDEKRVLELAAANRDSNNNYIWTDSIEAEQKNVEKVLASNGLQVVPETQAILEPNQVMNLSNNFVYNATLNRAVEAKPKEIEYLVYGTPEQVAKVTEELRGKVQTRQIVSQLPEKIYRGAIVANADSPDESLVEKTSDRSGSGEDSRKGSELAKRGTNRLTEKLSESEPQTKYVSAGDGVAKPAEKRLAETAKSTAKPVEAKEMNKRLALKRQVDKDASVPAPAAKPTKSKGYWKALSQPSEAKPQQAAAVMITLRYRAPERLNTRQEEAITNLELQNSLPLSQRRMRSTLLDGQATSDEGKPATSQPASTTTAPSSRPAEK